MFNMIFHGKLNPYNKDVSTHRTFAPFPFGILYHAKYDYQGKSSPVADFYPARNIDTQFTYDVAIEHSNFEVNIDLTKLKESAPIQSQNQAEKAAIDLKINNFATQLQNLQIPGLDIELTTNRLRSRSEKDGMAALNQEIDRTYSIISNLLTDAVSKGTIFIGSDRSLDSKLVVSEDGIMSVQHTLLTDVLRSKNGAAVPVNEDGSTDYTQIANMEYNGGNNENFVLTLQNGNTITGTIDGLNIKIEDQTVYSIMLNNDQSETLKYVSEIQEQSKALEIVPQTLALVQHLMQINLSSDLSSADKVEDMINTSIEEIENIYDSDTGSVKTEIVEEILKNTDNTKLTEDEIAEAYDELYAAMLEIQEQIQINKNLICKIQ